MKVAVLILVLIGILAMPIIGMVTWTQTLKYSIIGGLSGGLGIYIYAYFSNFYFIVVCIDFL